MLSIVMMALALQDAGAAAEAPAAQAQAAQEQAQAAAEAPAAPRVVSARRPIDGYSEAGDAAGHTGEVVVEADVLPDGRFGPATVVASSRSPLLDAEAVEIMTEARVAAPAEPYRLRATINFNPTDILNMKCDEMVRQVRWYEAAWPERDFKAPTIYTMSVGLLAIVHMGESSDVREMLAGARKVEQAWPQIVADCERQPSRPYMQVLGARTR